ncbi:MAG: hypothetical protein GEU79_01900 [Acidimicrobiia bacterium]|nr:hypothetical protein [Acidimicrobiia bacterium]
MISGVWRRLITAAVRWLDSTTGYVTTGIVFVGMVMLPGLFGPFFADNRYTHFQFEAQLGSNPLRLIGITIDAIPWYLEKGNFRPVSRLAYGWEYWTLTKISYLTGVPVHILHAISKLVVIAALLWICNGIIRQYARASGTETNGYWMVLRWVFLVVLGVFLVLISVSQHPMMLFPGLYVGGLVFALAVTMFVGHITLTGQTGRSILIVGAVFGVTTAMMIELTYVMVPLVIGHLVLLMVVKHGWREIGRSLRGSPGLRVATSVIAGFLVVFVPVRVIIARLCSDGSCYAPSAVAIDSGTVEALVTRFASPILMVGEAVTGYPPTSLGNRMFAVHAAVVGVFALALLSQALLRGSMRASDPPRYWYLPGLLALGAWLVGASLGALSEGLEPGRTTAWRDTAILWPAAALTVAVVLGRVMVVRRLSGLLISLIIAVILSSPVRSNDHRLEMTNEEPVNIAHMRIDTAMARFDESPSGRQYRCSLLEDLEAQYDKPTRQLDVTLVYAQIAADRAHGEYFCPGSPQVARAWKAEFGGG